MTENTDIAVEKKTTIHQILGSKELSLKKIAAKRNALNQEFYFDHAQRDPMSKQEGGRENFIKETEQSLQDLENNYIKQRALINRSNAENEVTVCGETRTIEEWLIYKRDLLPELIRFVDQILNTFNLIVEKVNSNSRLKISEDKKSEDSVVFYLEKKKYINKKEKLIELKQTLENSITLKNAITYI